MFYKYNKLETVVRGLIGLANDTFQVWWLMPHAWGSLHVNMKFELLLTRGPGINL